MPIQDATLPSRRHVLADQRRRYGAYDEVRLAKMLPRQFRLQKRSFEHDSSLKSTPRNLVKRDDTTNTPSNSDSNNATLPAAPSNSGAVPNTPAQEGSTTLPAAPDTSGVVATTPATDPDDAAQQDTQSSSLPSSTANASNSTTHNDAASLPSALLSSPASSSGSDSSHSHMTHRTIATTAAVVTLAVVFIGLGCFFKRYRQKLSSHCSKGKSPRQRRKQKKLQRLGSIDGLRSVSSRKEQMMGGGEGGGSKEVLLLQLGSVKTAGPFDRAIGNMFSHKGSGNQEAEKRNVRMDEGALPTEPAGPFDRALCNLFSSDRCHTHQASSDKHQRTAADYLSVSIPPPTLNHQRSLESIVEVQEPPSTVSTQFTTPFRHSVVRVPDHMGHFDTTPSPPSRSLSYDRRPRTSPSTSRNSTLSSPESLRPATARHEREIEMTHTGSHLLIRDRPSSASFRRPLSSAGNSFRSALRKARTSDDGEICIETEGISDTKRVSWTTSDTEAGDYEVAVPARVKELRSHFSSSTLRTQSGRRESGVSAVSPAGSFSFEIREGVRAGAPVTLTRGYSRLEKRQKEAAAGEEGGDEGEVKGDDDFVRDLDWNLGEYTASDGGVWGTAESKS